MGINDFYSEDPDNPRPDSATVDVSIDDGPIKPSFNHVRIEKRNTLGSMGNLPLIRPPFQSDGTVYSAFYGVRQAHQISQSDQDSKCDVVVVRDDNWAIGAVI